MAKVECLTDFKDLEAKIDRKKDDVFEVEQERADYLANYKPKLVEIIIEKPSEKIKKSKSTGVAKKVSK